MSVFLRNATILSLIPGRVRMHLPGWREGEGPRIEAELGLLPGVEEVRASALTGNVLIHFDASATSLEALLAGSLRRAIARPELAARHAPAGTGTGGVRRPVRRAIQARGGRALLRAGLLGVIGHALVDTVFYAVTFTNPFGLPLAPLGVLHLGLDVFVWTAAFAPLLGEWFRTRSGTGTSTDRIPPGLCARGI
jgi:hypothetical protein